MATFRTAGQIYQSQIEVSVAGRIVSVCAAGGRAGCTYQAAGKFLDEVESNLQVEAQRRARQPMASGWPARQESLKTIEHFRANPAYGGDGTRSDLAFAIYALSHGVAEDQVDTSLRSRDLSHKGNQNRQSEYVNRTIKKALALTEGVISR